MTIVTQTATSLPLSRLDRSSRHPSPRLTICSFDIFDTFLLRACTTPDGVFERAFELSPLSISHPRAATSFVQHRIEAEARARIAKFEKTERREISINEIYARFPFRLFGLDRSALPILVNAELAAEHDLCRANAEILVLYRSNRLSGIRTGFISDTYWNGKQIASLLHKCAPDLTWDFLYCSCEAGTSKSENLFDRYMAEQGVAPANALHIGDNEGADIKPAQRRGVRTRHYPQATPQFAQQLNRESALAGILDSAKSQRLDRGFRTLRRLVAARTAQKDQAHTIGVSTLGPLMYAFDRFIQNQVERIRAGGGHTAVAFLGRDGYLSHAIWQDDDRDGAHYLELNRRISLMASAETPAPLADLLKTIPKIDARTFGEIVKFESPDVAGFFAGKRSGIVKGSELAEVLPRLLNKKQIRRQAQAVRGELLDYLRKTIAGFDAITDLVLVDLGYSGSIQKALRRALDCEGIDIRLHGVYLLSRDEAFEELAPNDTATGFISDLVVTPHFKRALTRNVSILEHLCCAPTGSVRSYDNGAVRREPDVRQQAQIEACSAAQDGARAFVKSARQIDAQHAFDPLADAENAAHWAAIIFARLILLPSPDETVFLGAFQHDVNLGTTTTAPMVDVDDVKRLQTALGPLMALTAPPPPMWMSATFASISPLQAYLYALFAANRLGHGIFSETRRGTIDVGLFKSDGTTALESVPIYWNDFGHWRVKLAVTATMHINTIVVPLRAFGAAGLIDGPVAQTGTTLGETQASVDVRNWPTDRLGYSGVERHDRSYRVTGEDPCLILDTTAVKEPMTVITFAIEPFAAPDFPARIV
jgi:FMN phosphatase YigB (HAD superfamily)